MKTSCFQKCSYITELVRPCAGLYMAKHIAWEEKVPEPGGSCGSGTASALASRNDERFGKLKVQLVWHG